MKSLLSTLSLLFIFSIAQGQETDLPKENTKERVKEVGLTFSSLNSFGLTYRVGNSGSVWRFNTAFLSGGQSDIFGTITGSGGYNRNFGFGLQIGREFRKPINDHFEFRSGTDVQVQFSRFENKYTQSPIDPTGQRTQRDSYLVGVNLVLGANYMLKNNLIIGAEIQPFIAYNETKSEEETKRFNGTVLITETFSNRSTSYNYGISNQGILLSIAYRY